MRMCAMFISVVVLACLQLTAAAKNEKADFSFPDDLDIGHFPKHHHHHDFYHHHHHNYGPEAGDDPVDDGPKEEDKSRQIPLEYIQNLNDYNVSDLLLNFVERADGEDLGPSVIQNRFGEDEAEERSAATIPKGADCIPELKTVKLASSGDASILYIPQCTRVEQCGGCCKHDLLSCQPLKTESIPFKVYKTQYTGEKKLKFLGTEVMMVEKHVRCKCQCRVKAEDCTKFQQYREGECGCVCVNFDEKKKCLKHSDTKIWDPNLCTCQCKNVMECSTGSYFDPNDCKCVISPLKRRTGGFQRRSYRSEIVPIVPLDEN